MCYPNIWLFNWASFNADSQLYFVLGVRAAAFFFLNCKLLEKYRVKY